MPWRSARGCRSGRRSSATSRRGRSRRSTAAATGGPIATSRRPARDLLPRRGFLTTTSLIATRGCHNRCGFCYLATDGLTMPYQVRDVEQVVAEFRDDGQPYGVFIDNNLGSRPEYLRELCPGLAAARGDLERRRDDRRDRRPVAGPRDGDGGLHRGLRRIRVAGGREPRRGEQEDAEPGGLRAAGGDPARPRNPGQRQLRPGLRPRPGSMSSSGPSPGSRRPGWSAPRSTS